MPATLLEISDDLLAFNHLLDELDGGEMTPEVEQAVEQWFAELGDKRDAKLDNYCALIRTLELRASIRKAEAERLMTRYRVDTNNQEKLEARLHLFLTLQGIKKIETDRYRIAVHGNGGLQPLDITTAPEKLPEEFQKKTIEANTTAIRESIAAGKPVPGCVLKPRGTHLSIK